MSKRKRRADARMGQILLAAHRNRYGASPYRGYSWPHPMTRAELRRLVRMGLVRWSRPGKWGHEVTNRRTRLVITDAGEEAVWRGELPKTKPVAKSKRAEKRGRQLRGRKR